MTSSTAAPAVSPREASAEAAPRSWHAETLPLQTAPGARLTGVSCPDDSFCAAVSGNIFQHNRSVAFAEVEQAGVWQLDRVPALAAALDAVSCTSATACVAVGRHDVIAPGSAQALAYATWDGSAWTSAPITAPVGDEARLHGISCLPDGSCVAVGSRAGARGVTEPLAMHFAGGTWTIDATPEVDGGGFLTDVSCASADRCLAIGSPGTGPVVEQWDGQTWSDVSGLPGIEFTGVSCWAAGSCAVLGVTGAGPTSSQEQLVADVLQQGTWTTSVFGRPVSEWRSGRLSCAVDGTCTGLAELAGSPGAREVAYDGTWQVAVLHEPSGFRIRSPLTDLSCPPAFCLAVGATLHGLGDAVAERITGATATSQPIPQPAGQLRSNLYGVSCSTPAFCLAVGSHEVRTARGLHTAPLLAVRRDGHWRPLPTTPPGRTLWHVACSAPGQCVLTGLGYGGRTLAVELDHGAVRRLRMPLYGGGAVACPQLDFCLAVGERGPATGYPATAVWHGGTGWRLVPLPERLNRRYHYLQDISCVSSSFCLAAGSGPHDAALLARWDGTRWHLVPTAGLPYVRSVSCVTQHWCMLLAGQDQYEWHDGTFTVTQRPVLPAWSDLHDVTCASRVACQMGGMAPGGTALFLRWNGRRWRESPLPVPASDLNDISAIGYAGGLWVAVGITSTGPEPLIFTS